MSLAKAILLLFINMPMKAAEHTPGMRLDVRLAQSVSEYDNSSAPFITTLLRIAAQYHLPMGIEKVTVEALQKPITVKLRTGSLVNLLDSCIQKVPDYAWTTRDGAIHVFGTKEREQASNLFNLVIPFFEIRDETIDAANEKLRTAMIMQKESPAGIFGSYLGSPDLEKRRLSLRARNATIRDILNRMVALHGEVAWVARVSPNDLSRLPQAGLWQLLPRSVQDPKPLLDPSLSKDDRGTTIR